MVYIESRLAHAGPSLEEGKVVMILGAPVISTTRTGAPDTLAAALGTRVHSHTAILKRPACCHPPQTAPHYRPRGLLITFPHSLANYCPVIAIDNPIEATRRCR